VDTVRGANLVGVRRGDGAPDALVRVPNKFKDMARFRRGTYVLCAFASEATEAGVSGEVTRVLYGTQTRELRARGDGTWPEAFEREEAEREGRACALGRDLREALSEAEEADAAAAEAGDGGGGSSEDDDDDDDDDDDLPPIAINPNRRRVTTYVDSDESDSDSD